MDIPVISIIGAGHMGGSLVKGLIASGHPSEHLWVSDLHKEKLAELQQDLHVQTTTDNSEAIEPADVVILAVKPHTMEHVVKSIAWKITTHKLLLLSVAAGISTHRIHEWLQGDGAIVRCMPNMPALISCGATALYANQHVSQAQRNIAERIMRAVGITTWLEQESLMDIVTALSGSGPAYFFLLMEALEKGAQQLGMPKEMAKLLTLQTALGAARMAYETGESVTELRQQVTSKGGTTEQAISVFEEHRYHEIVKKALEAAQKRSQELGNK